jgi:hypothetical protein
MTLKEKFLPRMYCFMGSGMLSNTYDKDIAEDNAMECEKVADDYAIEFSEWCASKYMKLHSVWCPIFGDQRNKDNWKTTKDLLEQFKKEKGL